MDISASVPRHVRFGDFELDLRSGDLRKGGARLNLPDQPLQFLTALLQRPGQIVTRDELRQRLWAEETFVDFEHGLNAAVKRLRDTLGDSADTPRFIETDPHSWADKPRWSPDGKRLYFWLRRGSVYNVWGLRFDDAQGTTVGAPFQVTHFDGRARQIDARHVQTSEQSVSRTSLLLPMSDTTGSIWMLDNMDK
jgi:hypothetical protein